MYTVKMLERLVHGLNKRLVARQKRLDLELDKSSTGPGAVDSILRTYMNRTGILKDVMNVNKGRIRIKSEYR